MFLSMRNWGERFRDIRESKGMTQQGVADRAGTTRITVQAFELRGEARFSYVLSLIGALDMTEAEFFESRVVEKYANPRHQELHEKLQEILESDHAYAIGSVDFGIEAAYREAKKIPPAIDEEAKLKKAGPDKDQTTKKGAA